MEQISRRGFAKGALSVAALIAKAPALASPLAPAEGPDLSAVAPELRGVAAMLLKGMAGSPEWTVANMPAHRAMMDQFAVPALPAPTYSRELVKLTSHAPDVGVYVINAQPGERKPAVLYIHGGGFVTGRAGLMLLPLQQMARELDCVVVSVDYRLAPETTFKGSVEDNYAALKWLHDGAARLGVNPSKIAVMGDSAGGGHAALLAIAARDRGEVPLAAQILVYPMLDDRTGSSRMPAPGIGAILWTAQMNRFGWNAFLGQRPGTDRVPPAAVPARHRNLTGLPPTFIGVGSIDLFVDEDIEYAHRLIDAGVSTELLVVPGAFHAFDGIAHETAIAKRFTAAKLAALQRAFEGR